MSAAPTGPEVAKVDYLIDDTGGRVDVPDNSGIKTTDNIERAVASTGPAAWSRWALLGIAIVAFVLLMMQIFQGAPGTDVQPGTPTAEPVDVTDASSVN